MTAVQPIREPMHAQDVSIEWLRTLPYQIQSTFRGPTIEGVIVKDLRVNLDGRGDVIELWSKPWIEAEGLVDPEHVYQSATDYGVVKCWHLHERHTDQFTVTRGKLQVTEVIVVNLQSHVYDATDEFKFPWDCVLEEVWEPRNG